MATINAGYGFYMELEKFEEFLIRQRLADRTIDQHVRRVKTLLENCKPFNDETVNSYIVRELIQKDHSGSSVNKYVQAIHKYCDFKGLGWRKNVSKVKEDTPPRILLSKAEIEAFIQIDTSPKMNIYWQMLCWCGMRPKEALELTVDDIDMQSKCLYINRSKTKQGRAVPIPPQIQDELVEYVGGLQNKYLFPGTKARGRVLLDQPMSSNSYQYDFTERMKRLGIRKSVTPYSLRHSFITRILVDAKQPLFVVQDIVGHKKADTTRQYYHGSLKAMHEAIQKDPMAFSHLSAWEILKKFTEEFLATLNEIVGSRVSITFDKNEDTQEMSIKIKVKKRN